MHPIRHPPKTDPVGVARVDVHARDARLRGLVDAVRGHHLVRAHLTRTSNTEISNNFPLFLRHFSRVKALLYFAESHPYRAIQYTSALLASVSGFSRDLRAAINLAANAVISAVVSAGRLGFGFHLWVCKGKLVGLTRCFGCAKRV